MSIVSNQQLSINQNIEHNLSDTQLFDNIKLELSNINNLKKQYYEIYMSLKETSTLLEKKLKKSCVSHMWINNNSDIYHTTLVCAKCNKTQH